MGWLVSLWDWIWNWFHHKPKNRTVAPGTGATRYAGAQPRLTRSSATISYLRQPGAGAVQYSSTPPELGRSAIVLAFQRTPVTGVVRLTTAAPIAIGSDPHSITPDTGGELLDGQMPHQVLQVQAPDTGLVVIAGDPPVVTRP